MKLMFKLTSLVPRRSHVIKIYFFFKILVKVSIGNRDFNFELKLQLPTEALIFELKPQLSIETSFFNWNLNWQLKHHFLTKTSIVNWGFKFYFIFTLKFNLKLLNYNLLLKIRNIYFNNKLFIFKLKNIVLLQQT